MNGNSWLAALAAVCDRPDRLGADDDDELDDDEGVVVELDEVGAAAAFCWTARTAAM